MASRIRVFRYDFFYHLHSSFLLLFLRLSLHGCLDYDVLIYFSLYPSPVSLFSFRLSRAVSFSSAWCSQSQAVGAEASHRCGPCVCFISGEGSLEARIYTGEKEKRRGGKGGWEVAGGVATLYRRRRGGEEEEKRATGDERRADTKTGGEGGREGRE